MPYKLREVVACGLVKLTMREGRGDCSVTVAKSNVALRAREGRRDEGDEGY